MKYRCIRKYNYIKINNVKKANSVYTRKFISIFISILPPGFVRFKSPFRTENKIST